MIGAAIREAREARGLDRRELAALCDVHPSTISRIEKDTQIPRPDLVERLARELGIGKREARSLVIQATRLAYGRRTGPTPGGDTA